jgi:hypothetical protein
MAKTIEATSPRKTSSKDGDGDDGDIVKVRWSRLGVSPKVNTEPAESATRLVAVIVNVPCKSDGICICAKKLPFGNTGMEFINIAEWRLHRYWDAQVAVIATVCLDA